ncbi:hypothetical protein GCM10017557_69960 [Streptomyces aurantiacus]|uniref:Uncharacterized protein n=1 Tax=Streptomyces aurantiacus TaxID=47760 RepID=A0A7G1PEF4_9ACTN|nr:hypothetical protein GCM10017557_69960 [Streptomyces aurantiacus]
MRERAAVERVALLADLRPQVQEAAPGLLTVAAVEKHDDLSDPGHHRVRRRLLLSLRHRVALRPLVRRPARPRLPLPRLPTLMAGTDNRAQAAPWTTGPPR